MTQKFQSLKSSMELLQIFAPQSFDTFNRFNLKRSLIVGYMVVYTVCLSLCFIPSQTFAEYSQAVFIAMTGVLVIVILVVFYYYIPDIFELICDFKSIIEIRKFLYALLFKLYHKNHDPENICMIEKQVKIFYVVRVTVAINA